MSREIFKGLSEPVGFVFEQDVAWVVLNNPRRRNAWSSDVASSIRSVLNDLKEDREKLNRMLGVAITGSGDYFSAGIDLREVLQVKDIDGARELVMKTYEAFKEIALFPKPVVCVVNGPAYGLSVELFHIVDYVLASDRASFAITGARFGIVPPVSVVNPRGLEARRISYIIMSGTQLSSEEALKIGLVDEVVEHEKLYGRALEILESFSRSAPHALAWIREVLGRGRVEGLEEGFEVMARSIVHSDTRRRVSEFFNRK